MLTIYKKVEKCLDNPSGIIEIKNIEELNRPFLLCISAQDNNDKSIYGIIREGAQAARVYTTQEIAAGFKINEFPADFLGLRFIKDNTYKNNYDEIVDKFLYPFLIKNGIKEINQIIKQARKINLMTYCDGTITYEKIEEKIEEKLKNNGFSQDDIDFILSQISLVAIGTMIDTSNFKATTVTFIDVNDDEIYNNLTNYYKKMLQDRNKKSIYGTLNKNNILYVYEGTGNHKLKEYLLNDRIVKPAICGILSHFLENSIENEKTSKLIAISKNFTLNQLMTYANELIPTDELLKMLDSKLSYDNSPKYTKKEAKIRYELDMSYRELKRTKEELKQTETYLKTKEKQISDIISGIRKYSSETAFYQILVSSGVWQKPEERAIFEETSDKTIREYYNSLNFSEEQINNNKKGTK